MPPAVTFHERDPLPVTGLIHGAGTAVDHEAVIGNTRPPAPWGWEIGVADGGGWSPVAAPGGAWQRGLTFIV